MRAEFVAIDVETATSDQSTICQIGAAFFAGGELVDTYSSLVDPGCEVGYVQQQVHGLDNQKLAGAPKWGEVGKVLLDRCRDLVVASHSMFDRNAVSKANANAGLEPLASPWLNTINVVRRAWPDRYEKGSCGLKVLADHFGIEFQHHDALEDAIATGRILAKAIRDTGLGPHDWIARCNQPIRPKVRIRKPAMTW